MLLMNPIKKESIKALKASRKLEGLNELMTYALMYNEGTMMLKDGAFAATFKFRGPDVDSSTDAQLTALAANFVDAIRHMNDGWMLDINLARTESTDYPKNTVFPDPICSLIEDERRAQYEQEGAHFDTETYFTITFLAPEMDAKVKKFAVASGSETAATKEEDLTEIYSDFEKGLIDILDVLSRNFLIERLVGEDLLSVLHYCITGLTQKLGVPEFPVEMDTYLATQDFVGGFEPKIGDKHIAVLSISTVPQQSYPTILDTLNTLPLEYRWSMRFIPMSIGTAEKVLKEYKRTWSKRALGLLGMLRFAVGNHGNIKKEGDAAEMEAQIEDARIANRGEVIRYGFLSNTIVLMDSDAKVLADKVAMVKRRLAQIQFGVRHESLNAVDAYLGSLPSHGYYNIRRPCIDSIFVSHTAPISSIYQGERQCPCPLYPENAPPLFYSRTTGATPFRFNHHIQDVGHMMIIGRTGSGKTTLLNFIAAQHRKYANSRIFTFDKDYSAKAITLAAGGDHYDIGSENSKISLAPLSEVDTDDGIEWAAEFIEDILHLNSVEVDGTRKTEIRKGLERLRTAMKEHRTLASFSHYVQDDEVRRALDFYVSSANVRDLLGGWSNSIKTSSMTTFEMDWLSKQKPQVLIPTLSYLFRVLEKEFDHAYPTLLILDEAWLYISNEIFARKLKDWLKTLRKKNVSVIFASQSLDDVVNSSVSSIIIESCLTKIYLPNDSITPMIHDLYTQCGLNEQQIQLINFARVKREYYVTSPNGNRLIDLGLGPVALSFIGNSKTEAAELYKFMGSGDLNWPAAWLKYRGQSEWAEYYLNKYGVAV